MKKNIKNLNELSLFVKEFLDTLKKKNKANIVALSGDLGAGKTAFVKSVAKHFGIKEEVTSPTFVIQKEYEIEDNEQFKKMIHIDAYRLENKLELEYLGWKEIIANPENIIFMEWPEQVNGIEIPEPIKIKIKILDDASREVEVRK